MAVVGDLRPDDEFMHVATADSSFNESMMFNFFDSTAGVGGFVRIGNRVNERHAEVTLCVFLPDGSLLFEWSRSAIAANDRLDAAGLSFEVIVPTERLKVRFSGHASLIRDPLCMRNPTIAFGSSPRVAATLDLDIQGIGPIIGSAAGKPSAMIFLHAVGHYQQALQSRGKLCVNNVHHSLQGFGARDHSWGKRVWSSLLRDRSFWVTFGPDLGFICCKTWLHGGASPDIMGCVIEQGRVTRLRTFSIHSWFTPGTHNHERCDLHLEDSDGRCFDLLGNVRSYVPLRHRTPGRETVYLGQAMTEFRLGERKALGLSEYFDAASACPGIIASASNGECIVD